MYSNVFIIYELSSARQLAVLHSSSRTWFPTSRYCRANFEFNSINLVRHGSSTTFETGLRCFYFMAACLGDLNFEVFFCGKNACLPTFPDAHSYLATCNR